MVAVGGQFQNREQRGEFLIVDLRRGKPHVVIDRPPRQQPRLLKHHTYPCACRIGGAALIIMVEAGNDLQHGTLAAAGLANEHANLSRAKRKVEIGEYVVPLAGRLRYQIAILVDSRSATTLLVTHDVDDAIRLGDRLFLLSPRPARILAELPIRTPRRARGEAEIAAIKAEVGRRTNGDRTERDA